VEPEYEELLASLIDPKRPFESLSEFFGFPLGRDQRRRSKVARKELVGPDGGKVVVYFKLYGYRRLKRALSRVFKPTRSKSEKTNLLFFKQLGIPVCEVVMQGEYKNVLGIARNCMLITREVSGTSQLDEFIKELDASEDAPEVKVDIRRQIMESIAGNLRKIHDEHFYHDDLKWRNILVRRVGENRECAEVFWIDCPNGYFDRTGGLRGAHGKIKDLSTMEEDARKQSSQEEMMQFLSIYSKLDVGSPELEALAQKVVAYSKGKW